MVGTKAIAVAMVPIILILNYPKYEHEKRSDFEWFFFKGSEYVPSLYSEPDLTLILIVVFIGCDRHNNRG